MYVDASTIVEHQFMNVGPGAHAATMLDFFARHGFSVVFPAAVRPSRHELNRCGAHV